MAWLTQDMFHRALNLAIDNTRRVAAELELLHRVA
jgi:hypothetical protein